MSVVLRNDNKIFLIGSLTTQILGSKLPSIGQVLKVFFYNLRIVNLTIRAKAVLTIRECNIFWEMDDSISTEIKKLMVVSLNNESIINPSKRFILSSSHIDKSFSEKTVASFLSKSSMKFFKRFDINTNFLNLDPSNWNTDNFYLHGKEIVCSLKVVNDSADKAVKVMEDFHESLTVNDEKAELLLHCVFKSIEYYILIATKKH
ncbi:uncharacterized protein LOC126907777 [Daktulosphaira vitifoliae]|uniref:uncharacterized protein LOC126896540 n=2 Tax=Daktulosphaira vitifoliae TaxID=58002 RepID=UPI0021AA2562|nr:uncharacterized protein LOC126896540 [Daktulosphaira vitifoliae]XP_050545332.1 uncharacterized protein LOC126907777 [Daktulosphaira vitifoliae]